MDNMLGVTLGVGEKYLRLAHFAAERLRRFTGLNSIILDESHFRSRPLEHIHLLKLHAFDLVESENILYYDADLIFVDHWRPQQFAGTRELICVRDIAFADWIQQDSTLHHIPPFEYFNSGFFIANRLHHEQLFRVAQDLAPFSRSRCFVDQTCLNWARSLLNVPVKFLSKRFNWVMCSEATYRRNLFPVVGAHIPYREHGPKLFEYVERFEPANTLARARFEHLEAALADRLFFYHRVGHDARPMQFLPDNSIGYGTAECERFWFIHEHQHRPTLTICSENEVTCQLQQDENGIWRGRWSDHERMPVELLSDRPRSHRFLRGPVLYDLLTRTGSPGRPLRGAEIGVHSGTLSAELLTLLPGLFLYMVDAWRKVSRGSGYAGSGERMAQLTQPEMDEAFRQAILGTMFAKRRRFVLRDDFVVAAQRVNENELDFVFLDADHSYPLPKRQPFWLW